MTKYMAGTFVICFLMSHLAWSAPTKEFEGTWQNDRVRYGYLAYQMNISFSGDTFTMTATTYDGPGALANALLEYKVSGKFVVSPHKTLTWLKNIDLKMNKASLTLHKADPRVAENMKCNLALGRPFDLATSGCGPLYPPLSQVPTMYSVIMRDKNLTLVGLLTTPTPSSEDRTNALLLSPFRKVQ